jgi:arsenate reductase (thioredoxin)
MVFVCLANSCRSQMAEAFARRQGAGRVAAYSAGSHPAGYVHPRTVRFMKERGLELLGHWSKGLGDLPQGVPWDFVVTMGCGDDCPLLRARNRLDWRIPDPVALSDEEFRQVRDLLEEKVAELVHEVVGGRY